MSLKATNQNLKCMKENFSDILSLVRCIIVITVISILHGKEINIRFIGIRKNRNGIFSVLLNIVNYLRMHLHLEKFLQVSGIKCMKDPGTFTINLRNYL